MASARYGRLNSYSLDFKQLSILIGKFNAVVSNFNSINQTLEKQIAELHRLSAEEYLELGFSRKIDNLKESLLECFVKRSGGCYKRVFENEKLPLEDLKTLVKTQAMYYANLSQLKHLRRIAKVCLDVIYDFSRLFSDVSEMNNEINETIFAELQGYFFAIQDR